MLSYCREETVKMTIQKFTKKKMIGKLRKVIYFIFLKLISWLLATKGDKTFSVVSCFFKLTVPFKGCLYHRSCFHLKIHPYLITILNFIVF